MGTLFVDKLDPQSGTSLEIGSSGDTITIPSGATIANSGTSTGFGISSANTPLFQASLGANQGIGDQTNTKINMSREVLDSNSKYDTSNYRFTPGSTGYYQFMICITTESGISSSVTAYTKLYKNGSAVPINPVHSDITSASGSFNTFFIDEATSASDYYEAYFWHNKGSSIDLYESGSSSLTYWIGNKLT